MDLCIYLTYLLLQICLIYEDLVGEYSLSTRLWLFILFQWVAFIFMAALGATVPDVPEDVTIQLQRTAFLSSKVCIQACCITLYMDLYSYLVFHDVMNLFSSDVRGAAVRLLPSLPPPSPLRSVFDTCQRV